METIHTGAAAITFPTTPEAFIAYQEQLIGRRLKENEWETVAGEYTIYISVDSTDPGAVIDLALEYIRSHQKEVAV